MKKRRALILVLCLLAGAALPPAIMPILVPWSRMNCRHQEINIRTGQARYSWSLWFLKVSERVEDTPLSLALAGREVDVAPIESWQPVNTFSPGTGYSPHYRFHGAFGQARMLPLFTMQLGLPPERMPEVAAGILAAWQKSGSDIGTLEYMIEKAKSLEPPARSGGETAAPP